MSTRMNRKLNGLIAIAIVFGVSLTGLSAYTLIAIKVL